VIFFDLLFRGSFFCYLSFFFRRNDQPSAATVKMVVTRGIVDQTLLARAAKKSLFRKGKNEFFFTF
jgi:hypothetical protein